MAKVAGWKAWNCEHLWLHNETLAKMYITSENSFKKMNQIKSNGQNKKISAETLSLKWA